MDKQQIDVEKFISLLTETALSKEDRKLWLDLVSDYGPQDIIAPIQIYSEEGRKSIKLLLKPNKDNFEYTVPLKRDLLTDEAEKIVEAWDMYYSGDFEIESSSTNYSPENVDFDDYEDQSEIDSDYEIFAEELSKLNHSIAIKKLQDNEWRYGDKYSITDKTNPVLLPWEQLSEKNKVIDYDYAEQIIRLLEKLGYAIEEK